jgi:hypothetical protein
MHKRRARSSKAFRVALFAVRQSQFSVLAVQSGSSPILETRRTCAHQFAKHAGEMARILKSDIERHFQDAMSAIAEPLFGAFYSLQQNVT